MQARTLALVLALTGAAPAAAQVVQIGPFSGAFNESFETQAAAGMSGFQPCVIGRVFQGTADLCSPGGAGAHITGGWSFACQLNPFSGTWLYGTSQNNGGGYCEYTFDNPIRRFGGYFGTNTPLAGTVTLEFYDASNNLIGTDQYAVINDCSWTWRGWESTGAGISRIDVINSDYGGARVMMDAFEVDPDAGGPVLHCSPANNHSGGTFATLAGSSVSGPGVFHLECTNGPPAEFGYFLVSLILVDPGTPISNGMLCLGAPIGRYAPAAGGNLNSIGAFDANGTLQNQVGTSSVGSGFDVPANLPTPPGGVITAGTSYYFQCWFRDGNRSNFSDVVQFQ
jgi:hypothetical protein